MAAGMTPAKRFAVRTALVAGSTLATVIGAQNLVLLDTASGTTVSSSVVSTTASTTADSISSTVASSTVSTIREATTTSTTSAVAVVPTAQSSQQVTVPSVPTTKSSR